MWPTTERRGWYSHLSQPQGAYNEDMHPQTVREIPISLPFRSHFHRPSWIQLTLSTHP